ncbi:uncharacterized protein LOC129806499 [Phlebotomus papatasi]|uniref:uncharacterized protein LOC129806499 n=1 Tax=Phlebotomus papatasi TaxID=29031 RepID=UPI002483795F|nr:uncharacterized protein LOC129806499 [Phlebotomus papatasi]
MDSEYFTITQPQSILDLPEHFFLEYLSKYLEIPELFNFRCCSRMCRDLVDQILGRRKRLYIQRKNILDDNKEDRREISFRVIAQKCKMLREIHLINLFWLTDDLLLELLNNNTELEVLILHWCFEITTRGLHPLAVKCKKLHTLHIADVRVCDGFLQTLNIHNNHLEDICLSLYSLSEETLQDFFKMQHHLKKICMFNFVYVDMLEKHSFILNTIANYCKDLEYLDILDTGWVNDEAVLNVARNCPKITNLIVDLDKLSNNTIEYLKSKKIDTDSENLSYVEYMKFSTESKRYFF